MDNAGLVKNFKLDRILTEDEKKYRLNQKQKISIEPHYQLSVIKLNSTYLETVDKWYGSKGLVTGVVLASMLILGVSGLYIISNWTLKALGFLPKIGNEDNLLFYAGLLACILTAILVMLARFLTKESFSYTHFPTRFNRITRMVHIFPPHGAPYSVPWDEIFFTMAQADPVHKFWNVFGHVLDSERTKIINTFTLSVSDTGNAEGLLILKSHWEFIRRYMEDGPESVIGQIQFCLPISEKRESLSLGLHRLLANSSTASPILLPIIWLSMLFSMITLPFRFFAIQTSKIPTWPENIENQNQISNNDPYAIHGDAKGMRVAVFPEAAASANVKFEGPPKNPVHSNNT